MSLDARRLEAIRGNRDLVILEFAKLSEMPFGLDQASVAWVEGFIERQRVSGDSDGEARARIAAVLASYLGEAIIAKAGGAWDENESGEIGVRLDNGNWCFPFAKVAKQFADGVGNGESILSFYIFSTTIAASGDLDALADGAFAEKTKIDS